MGWQSGEFGSSHEGMAGTLLEDGAEPKPVWLDCGSAGGGRKTSGWWAYNGKYGRPRAAYLRGSCSCGWRGPKRYPLNWDDDGPYDVDESGPRGDWEQHIKEVESRAVPLPVEVADLLELLESRLSALTSDAPLAGIRAVGAVERIAKRIGWRAACDVDPDDVPWDQIARALGLTEDAARSRMMSYRPQTSGYWVSAA